MTTDTAVSVLVRMADSAFDGQHWHATMRNLGSLREDDWNWVPAEGKRSIRELVEHIGECKLIFASQVFGDGSIDWGDADATGIALARGSVGEATAWLRWTHEVFRDGIASLHDADLSSTPSGYWGKPTEVQWSIEVMIQHEVYHAGEINHIRALHHGNDAWGNDPAAEDLV